MSDDDLDKAREDVIAARMALTRAIEDFARADFAYKDEENADDDEDDDIDLDGFILTHAVVAFECYHPAAERFRFSYTTAPETTSPSASMGVTHRLVLRLERAL